jgi:hypothetical protein
MEPCVSVQAVNSTTLRIKAPHNYGTLDLDVTAGENWALFQLGDLSKWDADPVQKHLRIATLCPLDMCPTTAAACDPKHPKAPCGPPWYVLILNAFSSNPIGSSDF